MIPMAENPAPYITKHIVFCKLDHNYLTLHNFVQTENILNEVRESILNSEFDKYKESIING